MLRLISVTIVWRWEKLCNESAVQRLYSMILFKGGRGTIVPNISYSDALTDPDNREEFLTPLDFDKKYGTCFDDQQRNVKSNEQCPGFEGFTKKDIGLG